MAACLLKIEGIALSVSRFVNYCSYEWNKAAEKKFISLFENITSNIL